MLKNVTRKSTFSEYGYTDDIDVDNLQIITLEVMSDSSQDNGVPQEIAPNEQPSPTGDLLTEKTAQDSPKVEPEESKETPKGRSDLLEYMMRDDGSVVCKLCGEILQSRTHWYRHKYKVHVIHPLSPAPLFQCEHCLVYFKSRKGKFNISQKY